MVITDRFKRNIYLRLEFQPGTDEAIKAHLAKQMMQQKVRHGTADAGTPC